MTENITLELPAPAQGGRRLLLRLLPLWLLLAAGAGLALWLLTGRVASVRAVLDGMVFPVAADFPATVAALEVRPGDRVRQGQPVARMDGSHARRLAEARREVAGLRPPAAPDMEAHAARLKAAQAAEMDMARRLADARGAEARARKLREERVADHVRAQLALRSLDSRGGAEAVGQSAYASARQAEAKARARMEQAAAEFEQASLSRAAVDQEMERLRAEMLEQRRLLARADRGGGHVRQALGQGPRDGLPPDGAALLRAPADGRILEPLAEPGQMLERGEPVALLLPDSGGSAWVLAHFAQADAKSIQPGQKCDVTIEADGIALSGTVRDVLPPAMPENDESTGGEALVPVRIDLDAADGLPPPGAAARCVVRTRSLLP